MIVLYDSLTDIRTYYFIVVSLGLYYVLVVSSGLCGTLDDDLSNDLLYPDEENEDSTGTIRPDDFIISWRLELKHVDKIVEEMFEKLSLQNISKLIKKSVVHMLDSCFCNLTLNTNILIITCQICKIVF